MHEALLTPHPFVKVALAVPMRTLFDYKVPKAIALRHELKVGMRIKVPFGNSTRFAIIAALSYDTEWDESQVKPITSLHDDQPILDDEILKLANWAQRYYHHPIGEVLFHAMPVLLRKGEKADFRTENWWCITELGKTFDPAELKRAPRQQDFLAAVQSHANGISPQLMSLNSLSASAAKALEEKQLIQRVQKHFSKNVEHHGHQKEVPHTLNAEQAQALDTLMPKLNEFNVSLLDGITGSGKTEIYLRLIEAMIQQDKQTLVLVPEIGLTPQTLKRFENRFNTDIVLLHSNMNDRERLDAWLMARQSRAKVIIGTRSGIFVPCPDLGLIIIDEEHDASYKQQEGFRYHARDLAIVRAQAAKVPVILGSATPCFESLLNAWQNKYQWLKLRQRAGNAKLPEMTRVDLRGETLFYGFSETTLTAMQATLAKKEQVLIFLNRRGYAPTLMCHSCGWIAECEHCDVNLTVHKKANKLHCHHCDRHQALVYSCPECGSEKLSTVGEGTEQIEIQLNKAFKDTPILRVDRDSTQRKSALTQITNKIHEHDQAILIGTQMLAKGHHFPNVTLVVVMDADVGLFSADYRGMERTAQLIMQVSGRAGRSSKPGKVMLQTYHPDHESILTLCDQGYQAFAAQELQERKRLDWPPFCHQVLIRTESHDEDEAFNLLQQVRLMLDQQQLDEINYLGPYAAIIVKKAGQHRYLLSLKSKQRAPLHQLVEHLSLWLEKNTQSRKVRFAIDVDPLETY